MTLLPVKDNMQSTYDFIGCPNATNTCWDVWSAPQKYHWSTMDQWWGSTTYLKEGSKVVMPSRPKQLSLYMPEDGNTATMSGTDYSGLEIKLTYDDGEISGLPFVCKDLNTFKVIEAMSELKGEGNEKKSVSYCCTENEFNSNTCTKQKVPDMLVPDGALLEEKDILGGPSRWYIMVPTVVRQVLVPTASNTECVGVERSPVDVEMPDMDGFGTMSMSSKPDVSTGLPMLASGGELTMEEDIEKDFVVDAANITID